MYHKIIFGSMVFKVGLFFQTERCGKPASVWMTAISPHHLRIMMGNGVVDMEKKIALKKMGVLDVQEKLYPYLSSVMMVMIQHQYAIIFIQLQIEIMILVKDLIWMFAKITCKYRPAQF